MDKQAENTKFIIQRFDNYIAGANVKGNFLLAFNTFLTGGIVANYSKIKELLGCDTGLLLLNIALCLLLVASVITSVLVIKAVYPFLKSGNSSVDKYHSHIYFNSISEFENDKAYYESFTKLSDNDFNQDLAIQAFQLSKGLKKKYSFLEKAMCLVYFELFLILIILILIIIF
jgi:hypothetical protein